MDGFSRQKFGRVCAQSLFSFSLAACGTPVCVGNLGDCAKLNEQATQRPTSGNLSMTSSAPGVLVRQTITFKAVGGTPPYAYSVIQGGGQVDAHNGTYTAGDQDGITLVRVTDRAKNTYDVAVVVSHPKQENSLQPEPKM